MFILWVLVITGITITALHWQAKFSKSGQTSKAIFIAVPYTIFAFQFLENHKLVFIFLFFYVTIALWSMVFVSMAINKQWAMEPKEEPYHN
mgnify:CR=1 FL=1